jgi:hypothetical protein
MKFLKVKDEEGVIHNIVVKMVIDYVEVDTETTKLLLDYPLQDITLEPVFKNADSLIEEIFGADDTDDIYEVINCTPPQLPDDLKDIVS